MLRARERLQKEAEAEFSRTSRAENRQRRFLDVSTIREIIMMRDEKGMSGDEIEKSLGLADEVVRSLGPKGVVGGVRVGKVTAEDAGIYD